MSDAVKAAWRRKMIREGRHPETTWEERWRAQRLIKTIRKWEREQAKRGHEPR